MANKIPDKLVVKGRVAEVNDTNGVFTFLFANKPVAVMFDKRADGFGHNKRLRERYTVGNFVLASIIKLSSKTTCGMHADILYQSNGICNISEAKICQGSVAFVSEKLGLVKLETGEEVIFTQASIGAKGIRWATILRQNRMASLEKLISKKERVFVRAIPSVQKYFIDYRVGEKTYQFFANDLLRSSDDTTHILTNSKMQKQSQFNGDGRLSQISGEVSISSNRCGSSLSANSTNDQDNLHSVAGVKSFKNYQFNGQNTNKIVKNVYGLFVNNEPPIIYSELGAVLWDEGESSNTPIANWVCFDAQPRQPIDDSDKYLRFSASNVKIPNAERCPKSISCREDPDTHAVDVLGYALITSVSEHGAIRLFNDRIGRMRYIETLEERMAEWLSIVPGFDSVKFRASFQYDYNGDCMWEVTEIEKIEGGRDAVPLIQGDSKLGWRLVTSDFCRLMHQKDTISFLRHIPPESNSGSTTENLSLVKGDIFLGATECPDATFKQLMDHGKARGQIRATYYEQIFLSGEAKHRCLIATILDNRGLPVRRHYPINAISVPQSQKRVIVKNGENTKEPPKKEVSSEKTKPMGTDFIHSKIVLQKLMKKNAIDLNSLFDDIVLDENEIDLVLQCVV